MRTLIFSILLTYIMGCSSYNIFTQKKVTSRKIPQEKQVYIEEKQTNSIFKSTLSSFVPIEKDYSNTNMSWEKIIKDFFMDSNMILYITSSLMLLWIIFVGIKYRHNFKMPKAR